METKIKDESVIVRYLLGELSEEEQNRLEDRAFSDREYLRIVDTVENDLIDEYARGELSDIQRLRFERRFLASPGRQRKVEFARALAEIVPKEATETAPRPATVVVAVSWRDSLISALRNLNPAFKFSMAAAALILVIGASWLLTAFLGLRAQLAQRQEEQQARLRQEELLRRQGAGERARSEDLAAQLQSERDRRARGEAAARQSDNDHLRPSSADAPLIASVFLPPGVSRGGGDRPRLTVRRTTRLAQLQIGLEREDSYRSFRAEVRTAQGHEVWTRDRLQARRGRAGRVINLLIPGKILGSGEYELTLKGTTDGRNTEDVRFYYFEALKK